MVAIIVSTIRSTTAAMAVTTMQGNQYLNLPDNLPLALQILILGFIVIIISFLAVLIIATIKVLFSKKEE